jgi:hypothetical protein
MGEAVYRIHARYASAEKASAARIVIRTLLLQAQDAYCFWQNNRGLRGEIKDAEIFWSVFNKEYPLVIDMLTFLKEEDAVVNSSDVSNRLAGKLGIIRDAEDLNSLLQEGVDVTYQAEVWHFSTWKHFAAWVKEKTGADRVEWNNDNDLPRKLF